MIFGYRLSVHVGLQRQYQQSLIILDMQSDLKLKLTN